LQIEEIINQDPELTRGEIMLACMTVLGSIVSSIQCRDCRRLAAKSIKKLMPRIITEALVQASGQQDSEHHH
jgi:hypothetical protein